MATLVLSTVGTVLGGPVGSAIGALIGQSIDQELFGGSSRGPRLGDLSVQTSSYGTQIPRIYGTMRVAGSIVWSTDLVESSATSGAKGQPDTVFSYCVSFAVALASRPIADIRRIWADGKLIRDEAGVFRVSTGFRFHDGSEDQQIDPLIGSIEGLANAPAYRGFAVAIFENLELAEFGNRIPFLTFEVVADDETPSLGAVLEDASRGRVRATADRPIDGYAAHGRSIRAAVEPLVDCYALRLFDDGSELRSPSDGILTVNEADLGCSADSERAPKLRREQVPATVLPAALRLSYYDSARDFQTGEARATASEQTGTDEPIELPSVMEASAAKSLAQQILGRRWTERDKLTLRLPPAYMPLKPGGRLELGLAPRMWTVERCTIEAFSVVTELRPSASPAAVLEGESGRIIPGGGADVGEVSLALFDVPAVFDASATQPTLLLAASSTLGGWRSRSIEVRAGSQVLAARSPNRKSVLGRATSVLGPGASYLIDDVGSVEIGLINADQWLLSCDDDELVGGANLAIVGRELIQFGEATPVGPGQFRLTRLLRGRGGTEWAADAHAIGEDFLLLDRPAAVQRVPLPLWFAGSPVVATLVGNAGEESAESSLLPTGESLRPPSPVHLEATVDAAGDLALSWTRRSRRGWMWLDEIDAALGETREEYRIAINGTAGSVEFSSTQPFTTIAAADLAAIGSGAATVQVRQIGDWRASRPVECTVILS